MMQESEFIVIPKKVGTVDCEKNRTISITSQVAKIVLKVIDERLKSKAEETTDEAQLGFRRRKGTRNAIFVLRRRMIMERAIEKQKDLYMCFVDFEKAFDRMIHELLIDRLRRIGADEADVRLLTNFYWEQKAVIKIGDDRSNWIKIEKGVRQGCVLSPDLFSLYSQLVMDEMEQLDGIKIGGRNINNIRYADDTVLLADTEERLQELIDRLDEEGRAIGLKINIGKTEVMGVTKRTEQLRVEAHVNGEAVRQVSSFRYLGSLISEDGRCDAEIKSRIAMAKGNLGKMRRILTNLSRLPILGLGLGNEHLFEPLEVLCVVYTVIRL